ncbi:MAG TPA: ATP-binding protein [Acidimicrobiia bacterium]|nr:ATP-binding protein [Acidimicrobiia bacterium]
MLGVVDTGTVIAVVVAATASIVAVFLWITHRRSAAAVDDALRRVSGSVPRKRRAIALASALDALERSTASAQRERGRLAGAVHTAPLGILITDDAGEVISANPAAERFLGSRLGEAVAEVRVRQAVEKAIGSRRAVEVEVELYTPVRSVIEVTAVPLDFGVESIGAVAFIVDVTDERRVLAMRRDFIANVSHELKTPLAALAVLAETLAAGVGDLATVTALAGRVESEAHRLAELVDDILDLSQAEAIEVRHKPVPIAAVMGEIETQFADLAADRGVALVVEPVPEEALVSGDRRQLRTMIANLVDNAIKYSAAGEGRKPDVRVSVVVDGGRVRVSVTDEGIGVSEAHLDRIFERFYRVDRARSRQTGGTGLGLSIVRHIARTHRGDVTVTSTEGVGSTFAVDLPRWEGE